MYYITDEKGVRLGEVKMFDAPVAPPKEEKVSGKKIALVVGHDQMDKGAFGNMGLGEYDYNVELLTDLQGDLPSNNEYNFFFRDAMESSYTKQMEKLHDDIDRWGAEISIEFHFNSFSDKKVNGHEVLYCSESGKKLAMILDEVLDKNLGNSDRGIKQVVKSDRGGGFCCNGKSKAIIIEPFFGANQNRFVHGGDMYIPYKKALIEFFKRV